MATFKFDISVDAWVNNIEITGASAEEAKEKLMKMSLSDIIKEGNAQDFSISDVEYEEEDFSAVVRVTDIEYDLDDEDKDQGVELPAELNFAVSMTNDDDIEDDIEAEIESITGFAVKDYDFEIIRKY